MFTSETLPLALYCSLLTLSSSFPFVIELVMVIRTADNTSQGLAQPWLNETQMNVSWEAASKKGEGKKLQHHNKVGGRCCEKNRICLQRPGKAEGKAAEGKSSSWVKAFGPDCGHGREALFSLESHVVLGAIS